MNRDHTLPAPRLADLVGDAHQRTLQLVQDLDDTQWKGPLLATVNPPLWEVGHVAFFYEAIVLRTLEGRAPNFANGEALFNSFVIAHDARWNAPLPDRAGILAYAKQMQAEVQERLGKHEPTPWETYLYVLAVNHEDMHDEAFTYTRHTLGYTPPQFAASGSGASGASRGAGGPLAGEVTIPGGTWLLGATPRQPFVFDNEKWAHPVEVSPFRIAKAAVSNVEFAAFVDDGGYNREDLWGYEGWVWRCGAQAEHPTYWRKAGQGWERRHYDRWLSLEPHHPAIHINWYEANAYCAWASRRLPTEAEWEVAASGAPGGAGTALGLVKRTYPWGEAPPTPERANLDGIHLGCLDVGALPEGDSAYGCRQMIGNTWEWTASPFYPFPGYIVDTPYREYSAPWFGYQKVLRGGAWATRGRLVRNSYRNFFTPDRRDVFAGFRTCAL